MSDHPAPEAATPGAEPPAGPDPAGAQGRSERQRLRAGLEAILFLADEPVPVPVLADVLDVDPTSVEAEVVDLAAAYERDGRGIMLDHTAGGWRMYTAAAAREAVEAWAVAGRTGRLTQAALETLAVIAYKQPISRQAIGDVRGVNADGAVRSLVARGLVAEVGRDPGPGQAVLYGTTTTFLERAGLDSLDDLPPLTDFLQDQPAPDEPELGALREVRRRLAAGEDLPTTSRSRPRVEDDDEDALPPPTRARGADRGGGDMDELSDRLESAARSAVDRLRAAVAAGDAGAGDTAAHGGEAAGDGAEAGENDGEAGEAASDGGDGGDRG